MKITLEPTGAVTRSPLDGTLVRVWSGRTEAGTQVLVLVAGVAVPEGQPPDPLLEAELIRLGGPAEKGVLRDARSAGVSVADLPGGEA